jgi:hypothetical protein
LPRLEVGFANSRHRVACLLQEVFDCGRRGRAIRSGTVPTAPSHGGESVAPRKTHPSILGWLVLLALTVGAGSWAVSSEPFPQNTAYHHFADERTLLGLPHCLNVLSNAPFVLVGAMGLWFVGSKEAVRPGGPFRRGAERWPFVLFFLGVGLTAFGSSYFHLDPTNARLLWDRLLMAVAFMALFAAVLAERVSPRHGLGLLPVLIAAGVASVLYWHWTEERGQGDLRP